MTVSLPMFEPAGEVRAEARLGLETGPRSIGAVRVLRISLTDRCNFRCVYCMPEGGVAFLPSGGLLSAEEIEAVARVAAGAHGIGRFKLTGGEPTLRADLTGIIRRLRAVKGVEEISLTTNGMLLGRMARELKEAGLDRVTVSVDSLDAARFRRITRTGDLATVLAGIEALERAGFRHTKINCVAMRGTNDDEFAAFAELTRERALTVRFIEYMPLGDAALLHHATEEIKEVERGPAAGCGGQDRGAEAFVAEGEVRAAIERVHGALAAVPRETESGVGPATVYKLAAGQARGRIGFISAMSAPFCATCNRLRLTAEGLLRSCLFDGGEVDLRPILRGEDKGLGREEALARAMVDCVRLKPEVHSGRGNQQMSRLGG